MTTFHRHTAAMVLQRKNKFSSWTIPQYRRLRWAFPVIVGIYGLILRELLRPRLSPFPQTIWVTSPNRTQVEPILQTWIEKNPEFTLVHHDNEQAQDYICQHFDKTFCEMYQQLPLPVMKADVWRYAVLFVHGGVYTDANAECRVPIRQWNAMDRCSFWAGQQSNMFLCQWTLASRPGNEIYRKLLHLIQQRNSERTIDGGNNQCLLKHDVHHLTGPAVFTHAVEQSLSWKIPRTWISYVDNLTCTWRIRIGASLWTWDVCIRPQGHIRYSPEEGYLHGFVNNRLELGSLASNGWIRQVDYLRCQQTKGKKCRMKNPALGS